MRDAILHSAAALAAEGGLRSVTMSKVAERAGIGRATLYRYFADVEAVLLAWHQAKIAEHVAQLEAIADRAEPAHRLPAVLEAFARLSKQSTGHHDGELEAFLHRDDQVDRARDEVRAFIAKLIVDASHQGMVRDDIAPDELAAYCLHALGAAAQLKSRAAVGRLVNVILSGLRPVR